MVPMYRYAQCGEQVVVTCRCDMSKPEEVEHVTPRFYMFAYPFFTAVGPRRGLQ